MLNRKFQAMGREELSSPFAEAIRKMNVPLKFRCCSECKYYYEDKNWCIENETSTTAEDCCDSFVEY